MLFNTTNISIVAAALKKYSLTFTVLDTVMLAKSGVALLKADAIDSIINNLFPKVSLITPNLPEAAALLNCSVADNEREMLSQGRKLLSFGCQGVLIKGGHLDTRLVVTHSGEWGY